MMRAMGERTWRGMCGVVLAAGVAAAARAAEAPRVGAERAASPPGDAVAVVAGTPISSAELEQMAGTRLFPARQQEYEVRRQVLEEAIAERLLAREAASRKISVAELTRLEVEGKAAPVTDAEKKAFYDQNKARFGARPEAEALPQIEGGLRQQRARERRAAFLKELRAKAGVKVILAPPRMEVAAEGPAKGAVGAPVTLVEFSDFQCPFCARVKPILKRLEEAYPGKLRIVFRDLPLLQLHKDAAHAAEAAACAHDQGKFWEMHDRLFADQSRLGPADLKQHAADLGLEAAAFNQCLDSGGKAAKWQKDADEATRLGLTGTPAFFINGRLLVGARSYDDFAQVIEEELELAASRKDPS